MDTLNEKIEELKKEDALQKKAAKKLKGMKILTLLGSNDQERIVIDLTGEKDIKELMQKVLKAFPCTEESQTIGTAGADEYKHKSGFLLRFKNGINERKAEIVYTSKKYDMAINLPVGFYSDEVKGQFFRKVYDSELHYFGGVPMHEIRKKEIRAHELTLFQSVKWYGGDVTSYIEKKKDKKKYEKILFSGHA